MEFDKRIKFVNAYYVATALAILKLILNSTTIIKTDDTVDLCFTLVIALIFLLKIMSQTYSIKKLLLLMILTIFFVYVSFKCNEYVIMLSWLAIIGFQGVDIRKYLKISIIIKAILILVHVLIYYYDLNFGKISGDIYYNFSGIMRYNFYLGNPNAVSGLITWTILEYIFLRYEKINIIDYIALIVSIILIYMSTRSRTMLIASMMFVVLLFVAKSKNSKIHNILKKVSGWIFPFLAICSILLSIFYYQIPNIEYIDTLLSRRVSLGNIAINNYGLTILPQRVDYQNRVSFEDRYDMNLTVDNLYIRMGISYSLIILVIVSYAFYKVQGNITEKEAIFIILYAVVGVTENYILNAFICFPSLFLGRVIYKEKKEIGEKQIEKFNIDNYSNV